MNRGGIGLTRLVQQQDDRPPATKAAESVVDVEELSPDDDAWLGEPSAKLELSWIEDDLQDTPVDDLTATEPVTGRVPAAPEMKVTPPPARKPPIRRPVVERIRPREELAAAARVLGAVSRRPHVVVVQALPSRRGLYLAYAGAIVAGVASGVAVLLLGR